MNTKFLFNASAIIEVLTGLALLVAPLFVIGLLLGDGLGPIGIAVTRVLGIGLLSVGVAGWESQGQDSRLAPRAGLCIYNVGAALVFVILGAYDGMNGVLLWPAAILHTMIGALMLWVILAPSQKAIGE
ncbi:MAG: hypothetical protein ACE1Z7_04075 [Woeseiaceae bacterium]